MLLSIGHLNEDSHSHNNSSELQKSDQIGISSIAANHNNTLNLEAFGNLDLSPSNFLLERTDSPLNSH